MTTTATPTKPATKTGRPSGRPARRQPRDNSLYSLLSSEIREQMQQVAAKQAPKTSGVPMDERVANMARTSSALAPFMTEEARTRIGWALIERSLQAWPEARAEGQRNTPGFVSKAQAAARAGMASLFADYVRTYEGGGMSAEEALDATVKVISETESQAAIGEAEKAFYAAIKYGSQVIYKQYDKRRVGKAKPAVTQPNNEVIDDDRTEEAATE
ncbi:MAG TPA: hypothetical protein PKV96_03090 [Candidatus Saccharimonas sp.]|nr:hypothetical protein [Candidatus Saccharimonas sp.]